MKNLFLIAALLLASFVSAQESYYGQIKNTTKAKGKTSTSIERVAVTIDEEYKLVSLSTDAPTRYKIVAQSTDEKTGITTYQLASANGDGTIDATISANTKEANFVNLKTKQKILFDSRYKKTTIIN